MVRSQSEYIDLYCYGMNEDAIKSSGFIEVPENSYNYEILFVEKVVETKSLLIH